MPQASPFGTSWQGSLGDLANIVQQIRRLRVFGRLSLRNSERLSIAQLYFRAGKLVHLAGNRGDVRAILAELQEWKGGFIHFDRGVTTPDATLNDEHEHLFEEVLMNLQRDGVVSVPAIPRVVEGDLAATADAKQLIAPWEWRILIEGTHRVSLAVAQLVGPQEASAVLQDILDDCSSAFPAFASLRIAPTGYLTVADRMHLDQMSRKDLLEGFTTLIATCQCFCAPLIGEVEAHKLIIQALREVGPSLVHLGVFRMNNQLLSGKKS